MSVVEENVVVSELFADGAGRGAGAAFEVAGDARVCGR